MGLRNCDTYVATCSFICLHIKNTLKDTIATYTYHILISIGVTEARTVQYGY